MDARNPPVLHCPTCYSTKFQTSRPRREDRLRLLSLKSPVRCQKCNVRIYASRSYVRWLRREEEGREKEKARDSALAGGLRSPVAGGLQSKELVE
jgi:hypothetical protein